MGAVGSADINKIAAALAESGSQSKAETQEVLVSSSNYIKAEMEQRVPVDTGRLKQSIRVVVKGDRVIIGPDTEYDEFVEFGTKPHVIEAKNKKALSFTMGGNRIVVKRVNHPGTRAQPYVRPAFDAWVNQLGELAAEANVKRFTEAAS